MYRKRDSGSGRAYSSADAYRALQNATSPTSSNSHATHSSSSEEEAQLNMRRADSPASFPDSSADHHGGDSSPLDPPRPFFLGGTRKNSGSSERGSWSSVTESVDTASDSDRDNEAAGAGASQAGVRRVRANTAGSTTSQANTQANVVRPRNHQRRRSSAANAPAATPLSPFDTPTQTPVLNRAPPSSFPFLSHAGNPDPGTPLPAGIARRTSRESFRRLSGGVPASPGTPATATGVVYPAGVGADGYSALREERTSMDVADGYAYAPVNAMDHEDLGRPQAPFMADSERASWVPVNGGSGVYRNSAAGAMTGSTAALGSEGHLPRTNSQPTIAMRAPFLSPASRPTSSLWSPPSYPSLPQQHLTSQYPPSLTYLPNSPYGSGVSPYKPKFGKAPMPSSRLTSKLSKEDKPWMKKKDPRESCAYWLTLAMAVIGIGCAGLVIYLGWIGVRQLKDSDVCLVLSDDFNSLDTSNTWTRDVELGGFGNGEFQMTTSDSANSFIKNGQLYIKPTLTSDEIGEGNVLNGYTYKLPNCNSNEDDSSDGSGQANCTAVSNSGKHQVIPPVKSARLNTKGHFSIQYGRVEVRAKLPRGDWLWPAIWMLPENNTYGPWPLSGEIDIMESRGNDPSYPAQGDNFVRSTLNYGVLETLQTHIIGWYQQKRTTYADDFHTYSLEWSPSFVRTYIDSRLQATLTIDITGRGGHSFFDRGDYPATAHNNSDTEVVIDNIWEKAGSTSPAAPFDKPFYLILDLAVGGTSGWFPDGVGNKPWFDTSGDDIAMESFAKNQSVWSKTWPSNEDDLSFRIDSVKMWKLKQGGKC